MTSRLDWYLDRVVHFDRSDPLTVDHHIVRATTDLRSDCLMRQLQRCRHPLTSSGFRTMFVWVLGDERSVPSSTPNGLEPLAVEHCGRAHRSAARTDSTRLGK